MTWQEIQGNGQPRRTLSPTILVSVGEASVIAPLTRAIAATTIRPVATPSLRVGPLYICNAERLPAMHSKETRT